jgi:hypothetical protein
MAHAIYQRQSKFKKAVLFLQRAVFTVCYSVGWVLLKAAKFLWPGYKWRRYMQNKLESWQQLRPGFTLATFVLLAVIIMGGFQVATLVASGQKLKGQVLGSADLGLSHLTAAQDLLQAQDTNEASARLALAVQSFEQSRADLNSNNVVLQGLLDLIPQKQDGDALLQATILLTQAGQDWTKFYELSKTVKVTPQGIVGIGGSDQAPISGEILQQMNTYLQAGRQKTNQALSLVQGVDAGIIPADKQAVFLQLKGNLSAIQTAIDTVGEVFDILYTIVSGKKEILFLFENNNELRPTGGFMGTFGLMKLQNGQINDLHISSIYDLDGQLKENFAPPWPVGAVNRQWYLRDTNWFTDFPQSARVITRFYEKESLAQTPDLIIALTPQFVVDVLKITGPVTLPRYNVTMTAENFVQLAQVESSVNYDKELNQPKQILADFFPTLLQQISDLSGPQLVPVVSALQQNLQHKHILLYAHEHVLQQRLEQFNWAGAIKSTDRDYLLVSASNLGGTKTDVNIKQELKLDSKINDDGQITNTLTITRANLMPDTEAGRNRSYIRVYVPQGSKLVSAQGFSSLDIASFTSIDQKIDPDVAAWEQASVKDTVSGTLIGQESGKTIFGNWVDLPGGQTKTVTLSYILPFRLSSTLDHYSLLVQKQPGTFAQNFEYSLGFPNHQVAWKNFQTQELDRHNLLVRQSLDQDSFWGLILQGP